MTATVDIAAVRAAVALVEDPEVPVRLVDLGVVRSVEAVAGGVRVVLRPTRLGCPGRAEMTRRVRDAAHTAEPAAEVSVEWETSAWDASEVSAGGSRVLVQIGYADPAAATVTCPYCASPDVLRMGVFGGSVCRTPFSCRSCGSTFDALRGGSDVPGDPPGRP